MVKADWSAGEADKNMTKTDVSQPTSEAKNENSETYVNLMPPPPVNLVPALKLKQKTSERRAAVSKGLCS